MTREQITTLFTTRQQYWRARDADALASAHSDDGMIMSPIFGTIRGRAAIIQSYRDLFNAFGDWTFTADELLIDGDRAVQVFHVHATHKHELFGVPATGRRFDMQGVLFFRLEQGKIAFEQRFYDFTGLLVQIGVIKAKPAKE